jgi:hypothetical protein
MAGIIDNCMRDLFVREVTFLYSRVLCAVFFVFCVCVLEGVDCACVVVFVLGTIQNGRSNSFAITSNSSL